MKVSIEWNENKHGSEEELVRIVENESGITKMVKQEVKEEFPRVVKSDIKQIQI